MTTNGELCHIHEKNKEDVDRDENMTSIMVRAFLSKAARIRRQRHHGDDSGPSLHAKFTQSPSIVQMSEEEGWEGVESPYDEAWYLEQAISLLFNPPDLSSTDRTQSDEIGTSSTTAHVGGILSVSSVCPTSFQMETSPSSSSSGYPTGLDVGACFVAHARLAELYHHRRSKCIDGVKDGGAINEDAALWYVKTNHTKTRP